MLFRRKQEITHADTTVRARAKINLTLDVTGRREDGYHTVEMVMQSIALHDTVRVTTIHGEKKPRGIVLSCSLPFLPTDERNLAYRAAELFYKETGVPLETCETMNGMWGYKITDQDYKSTKTLIHYLVNAAGKNANLLMNIGPQPDGELPAVALERLAEMGEWMKTYGETIYGTRGGIVAPHDWGVTTQKGNRLFVHILNLKDKSLFLPTGNRKVKKAFDFVSKKAVPTV